MDSAVEEPAHCLPMSLLSNFPPGKVEFCTCIKVRVCDYALPE